VAIGDFAAFSGHGGGEHAMAGTPNGCLVHTQSQGYVYRPNGQEVGEMEQAAYLAGDLGIQWIFLSGAIHACREAEKWVPGIITVPVKTGLAINCAIHLAPVDARKLIHERIREAIANAAKITPLCLNGPVVLEVERVDPWPAQIKPGAERLDAFTIRYTGDSVWQVLHHHFYGKPDLPLPE
jgi:D-amino peptidase